MKPDELPFHRFTAVGLLFVSDTAHTEGGVDSVVFVMRHILWRINSCCDALGYYAVTVA